MPKQSHSPRRLRPVAARLALAATTLASAFVGLTVTATPASAAPASISLNGHGWGHGRGLGQFGAQGYATMLGWSSAQILDHFYGTTGYGPIDPGQEISVRLTAMDGIDLAVTSQSAFTVKGADGVQYDQGAGRTVFFTIDGAGRFLVAGGSGGCSGGNDGWVQVTAPVTALSLAGDPVNDLTKMLTVCGGPTYRGKLQFLLGDGVKRTVNVVGVEDYVRGVVPRESPSWFAPAALEAQAVAARSYAMAEGGEGGSRYTYAKTCDSTSCQVYGGAAMDGVRRETTVTDNAVAATANAVRRFGNGGLARTEFSSSTGGWTAGGNFTAVPDDGDSVSSNPRHNWQTSMSTSAIAERYGVGSFVDLLVTQRNGLGEWGGRGQKLSIIGTAKSVSLTAAQFQGDWGLFSDWFTTDASNGPGLASSLPGRTDMVIRGADSALWQRSESNGTPSPWKSTGGTLTSDADLSSWGGGRLDAFSRGNDGGLWHRWSSNSGTNWSNWESLGGILASGPTAVSWGPNHIDIFATGADGAIWTMAWVGTGWTQWSSLGGGLIGDPDVASWGSGRLDLFIRGLDNAMWHRAFSGSWGPWESVGGIITSAPGVVSWGGNRIDMFARGSDGAMWNKNWTASGWSGWYTLNGVLASAPDAASPGVDNLVIGARGTDNGLWRISWNGAAWSGWSSLGVPS